MAEKGRPVLITGCSTGIGRATATRLAQRGWNVYATARRPESIADLAEAGMQTLQLDVTSEDSMREAVAAVEEREGAVGHLINNAGYSQSGAIETVSGDSLRRQFETNVFGLMRMCQLVLPGMRRERFGRIVNISSMGGELTFAGGGTYHATKHAVEAISDALRYEVAGFGVKVVVIQPGLIKTDFADAAAGSLAELESADGNGHGDPYGEFNAKLGALTKGVYDGPVTMLGGGPVAVARKIERALRRRNPAPRVRVTPSAHLSIAGRRLLTARGWDLVQRTQMPRPGR